MPFKIGNVPWNKGLTTKTDTRVRVGWKHSEESKKRISENRKGIPMPPEACEKIRRFRIGKKHSPETRIKLSEFQSGEKSFMYGKKLSEETKNKISESLKGNIHGFQKGHTIRKGMFHSEESKEKMRIASTGRVASKETRKKMGDSHKKYFKSHPKAYEKTIRQLLSVVARRPSKPELELFNVVKTEFPNEKVKMNHLVKTKAGNKFVDVAIPRLKLGFEYDEPYWHQDKKGDILRHHLIENEGWKLKHYTSELEFKNGLNVVETLA